MSDEKGAMMQPDTDSCNVKPPGSNGTTTVYETWEALGSKSGFRCAGRCVKGPVIDRKYTYAAWTFVLVPPIVNLSVCGDYLWHHVSAVLPVAILVLLVTTIVLVMLTSFTDPGIIPRRALQHAVPGLEAKVAEATGVPVLRVDPTTRQPVVELTREMEAEGYRWCTTCHVVRPPRTSHCKDCDNCVLRMDHHCPFVSNCIGQRNYAYFMAMLASVVSLGALVTISTVIYTSAAIDNLPGTHLQGDGLYVLLAIMGAPTSVMLLCVTGLAIFHAGLICRGRTTREVLRPNSNGPTRHGTMVFSRSPSLIQARALVEPELLAGLSPRGQSPRGVQP